MKEKFFETVSFHIVKPCNMKCKFCYATFQDFKVQKQLTLNEIEIILNKLKQAGVEKVTFAGGEPMLYKNLDLAIIYAKSIGLTTSIITNGSLLKENWLRSMQGNLDWIGLSIDSLNYQTNHKIGRETNGTNPMFARDYINLCDDIKSFGFKLKINTVVNKFNEGDDLNKFIDYIKPARWKVFDTLRVEGQNDTQFGEIRSTENGFINFIKKHNHQPSLVPESNELMTGSYLLIDPLGRLFENSQGKHTYSEPLQNNDINKCLGQINLNRETFIERGGIYNW